MEAPVRVRAWVSPRVRPHVRRALGDGDVLGDQVDLPVLEMGDRVGGEQRDQRGRLVGFERGGVAAVVVVLGVVEGEDAAAVVVDDDGEVTARLRLQVVAGTDAGQGGAAGVGGGLHGGLQMRRG